jgi:hypothetical protein
MCLGSYIVGVLPKPKKSYLWKHFLRRTANYFWALPETDRAQYRSVTRPRADEIDAAGGGSTEGSGD